MLLVHLVGPGQAQAERVAADDERALAGAGFAGRVGHVGRDFKQEARLPAAGAGRGGGRREGDAEAPLRVGGGGAVGNFLGFAPPAGRVDAAPVAPAVAAAIVAKQRPQLAPRDAVADRSAVRGLPGVRLGAAIHRQRLPQHRPAGHRVQLHQKGGPLVVLHRKEYIAVVGLQAHFAVEQARGQHQGAVETPEFGGRERQRLHSLPVHIHQPHAGRLAGQQAAFCLQRFGENALEI